MSQLFILVTVEIGIVNFFAGFEVSGETTSIPSVQSNTDNDDAISVIETTYKAIGPFNNDNDFANFQLGEFGVAQSNFMFSLNGNFNAFSSQIKTFLFTYFDAF